MLRHLLASFGNGTETIGVCLLRQLVKIGAFTYQLTDDVDMLFRDSLTYRSVFNERTDDCALGLLAPSAKRTEPCELVVRQTECYRMFLFHFELFLVNNL